MLKKLFRSVFDICRPGVDDPSCAWGGSSQKQPGKNVESQRPPSASEPVATNPAKTPPGKPIR